MTSAGRWTTIISSRIATISSGVWAERPCHHVCPPLLTATNSGAALVKARRRLTIVRSTRSDMRTLGLVAALLASFAFAACSHDSGKGGPGGAGGAGGGGGGGGAGGAGG